jgi:hypothetical protein
MHPIEKVRLPKQNYNVEAGTLEEIGSASQTGRPACGRFWFRGFRSVRRTVKFMGRNSVKRDDIVGNKTRLAGNDHPHRDTFGFIVMGAME